MCSDSVGIDPWHVPWTLTPQSDQTRVAHFQHRFTHFVLDASVHRFSVNTHPADADPAETMWLDLAQYRQDMMQLGLPKPIQRLLMTESLDSMCPVTLSPSPDTLGSSPFLISH